MTRRILYFLLIVVSMIACKSSAGNNPEEPFDFGDTVNLVFKSELEQETMQDMVSNLASPVEVAALLTQVGIPFSKSYLAPTEYLNDYNTTFKKAYALGVFGTNLGYLNMYNKNSTVLDYLSAVTTLAEELKVGQFFDFPTLKRLATNNSNLDSLMYLSVKSFNDMDTYLRQNKRSHISTLIITGLWIEGLYLAGEVEKEHPNEEITNRIGEQKIIINDLITILDNYKNDRKFAELIREVEGLRAEFEDVKISVEAGEPQMKEENGMLIFVQNEKTVVTVSPETLQRIIARIETLRNKLIQV
jgi:hypothetical protein